MRALVGLALATTLLTAACASAHTAATPAPVTPPLAAAAVATPGAAPTAPGQPQAAAATAPPPAAKPVAQSALLSAPINEIRTGQTFRLGDLVPNQVVIVKPMAVW
jgi:hypothetical protein